MRMLALAFVAALIVASCGPSGPTGGACPPPGPWPQPPGCPGGPSIGPGVASAAPGVGPGGPGAAAVSFTALVQPRYPGQRDPSVFPPSCDMLPTTQTYGAVAKVQCQDYKKGAMIFWKEEACVAMPFESGNKVCRDEREVLRKVGAENAAKMRKDDPDWWKTPYLNTYAYGDIRLRTEELQPTARIWAGGTWWGWRDDEIFMTHAAGIRVVPSHSFVKGPSDDALRDALLKEEGITVKGPQDMQKPEYTRIKTDLKYLLSHSRIYQRVAAAEAKDLDGTTVMTDRCDSPMAPPRQQCTSSYVIYMDATVAVFRDHLIDWYKAQVDAGADGIHIDDLGGLHPDEAFNDDTMRRFAAWLATDRPQALAAYGVAGPSSFNYRLFLKQRGYTTASLKDAVPLTSEEWRKIPLMVEFRTFLAAEDQRALIEIVTAVRGYAAQKGRSDFVITGNSGELAPNAAFLVGLIDMFSFEHDYMVKKDPMGYTSVVPIAKLANAKELPVTNEQVMGDAAEAHVYAKVAEPLRSDLIKLQIMESSAAHSGNHYIRAMQLPAMTQTTDEDFVYLAMEDRTYLAEVKKAFGFIQKHRGTYRDVASSAAQVAIVYDNDEVARQWREELKGDHQGAVQEAARALWARNVEFDIVNWKQLTARPYAVVFLPPSAAVGAERAALVAGLRAKGIRVYALWRTTAGVAVDGMVSGDETARIGARAAPPLSLPEGVRSIRWVNTKGDTIVHLMNYDYGGDGFRVKKDVRIDPAILSGATSVTYASLEHPDPIALDPKDPRVPEVRTYGLLIAKR